MNEIQNNRRGDRGFTLIEALVALLVLAFGMLAIAGFQVTLSHSSDLAKQRTEAMRLGQEKMEDLRGYAQVASSGASSPHIFNYTDDLVSSSDTTSGNTNASFTRTWTVTTNAAPPDDTEKRINVVVAWTDRTGAAQNVQLQSVISKFDPKLIGPFINGGSSVPKARRPKNRSINIPYPAVTLSGGTQSAFQPPPMTSGFYVFDNTTGNVIKQCANGTPVEGGTVTAANNCTNIFGYLLSGYVRFDTGNNPTGAEPGNPGNNNATLPLDASAPLSIDFSNQTSVGGSPSYTCYSQRQRVISTNISAVNIATISRSASNVVTVTTSTNNGFSNYVVGQTIAVASVGNPSFDGVFVIASKPNSTTITFVQTAAAESSSGGTVSLIQQIIVPDDGATVTGYTGTIANFIAYTCVVLPVDHDGSETNTSLAQTARRWWGKVSLTPNASASNGTVWSTSAYKVCRYSADYNLDTRFANSEHPLWYRGVTGALDSQNYLVVASGQNCPSDTAANPSSGKFANNGTVLHQPTSALSFQCTNVNNGNGSCSTSSTQEPSDTSTDLLMD